MLQYVNVHSAIEAQALHHPGNVALRYTPTPCMAPDPIEWALTEAALLRTSWAVGVPDFTSGCGFPKAT